LPCTRMSEMTFSCPRTGKARHSRASIHPKVLQRILKEELGRRRGLEDAASSECASARVCPLFATAGLS
jgi:hypothetical protein